MAIRRYKLSQDFLDQYKDIQPQWGYLDPAGNSLGEITFVRSYSRLKDDGSKETWLETCQRVIEGMFTIQREHCLRNKLPWDYKKAKRTAQEAFDRMFNFKWLPPGRGIANMGTDFVIDEWDSTSLQNCAFISTKTDFSDAMHFLMLASMNGVGVGTDTLGAGRVKILPRLEEYAKYQIPDTREGWAEALKMQLDSFINGTEKILFDYSLIRPAGAPIVRFGGTASGPESLKYLLDWIEERCEKKVNQTLDIVDIADIANQVGCCVVSGSSRRSAEILLGPQTEEYLDLKNYGYMNENGEWVDGPAKARSEWAWMSNNSVLAEIGQDYSEIAKRTILNGEPGYVWMDTARNFGRMKDRRDNKDWRAAGVNPCSEQILESGEMCVSGDTLIQTKNGIHEIEKLVGKKADIWNGEEWTEVTPFSTGKNKLYRVHISDGSYLDATPGHEWIAAKPSEKTYKTVTTENLTEGMRLPEYSLIMPEDESEADVNAYSYGWVAGDGYIDKSKVMGIVKADEYSAIDNLNVKSVYKEQTFSRGSEVKFSRVVTNIPLEDGIILRDNEKGLPETVRKFNTASLKLFFGGWIDTDGCLEKNENNEHYSLYGTEKKLREAQILLRRIGVNHATIRLYKPKGEKTEYGVRNHDIYRLTIPSYEAMLIDAKIKKATKFSNGTKVNNAHKNSKNISYARRQKIVKIELIANESETYCFNEPKEHKGVFGNVLTKQCTLVETFPTRHDDVEDYKKTLKVAYLYAKTVTLVPTVFEQSNAIMSRNRRIGLSQSGITTYVEQNSIADWRKLCNEGYNYINGYTNHDGAYVRGLDDIYSEWLCVRESIRTTTVKPSGTVSLLTGDSPGIHWNPASGYYIRRVTMGDGELLQNIREAGYNVEPSAYSKGQYVVSFPVKSPFKRSENEVTIWEKVALAAEAQHWWSDNSVSVTVSFDPEEEGKHIEYILSLYEGRLKTVSFLPMSKGVYKQMPYEEISSEQYEEMIQNIKPINHNSIYHVQEEAIGERFCTTDACMLPSIEEIKKVNENN